MEKVMSMGFAPSKAGICLDTVQFIKEKISVFQVYQL